MSIVRGVANAQDKRKNCVLMSQSLNQLDGGRVEVCVLYIDGKPVDHHVNREVAISWFDHRSTAIENPVKVMAVELHNVGGLSILETLK